jgi:hypothetical protein
LLVHAARQLAQFLLTTSLMVMVCVVDLAGWSDWFVLLGVLMAHGM